MAEWRDGFMVDDDGALLVTDDGDGADMRDGFVRDENGALVVSGVSGGGVESVNGKPGPDVVLTATDVGALAGVGELNPAHVGLPLTGPERVAVTDPDGGWRGGGRLMTSAATANTAAMRDGSGRMKVVDGSSAGDCATVGQLDGRLSAAQRTAIDALTSGASVDDVIAALKA